MIEGLNKGTRELTRQIVFDSLVLSGRKHLIKLFFFFLKNCFLAQDRDGGLDRRPVRWNHWVLSNICVWTFYSYHERLVRLPEVTRYFFFVDSTIILSIRVTSATWQLFNAYPWVNKCRVHRPHNTTCPVLRRIFPLVSSRQLIGHDWNGHVIDNQRKFPHNTFVSVYLHYGCREVSCKSETV